MSLVSPLARPLLASAFVADGLDSILRPDKHAAKFRRVEPVLTKFGVPAALTSDARTLARVSGVVTTLSALMLATGRRPRTSALTLAVMNIPLTLVNNPVWDASGQQRQEYLSGLLRGLSVAGGLLYAAADRGGKPSLGWRLGQAREHRTELRQVKAAVREQYAD
ncbi:DoxX family protein [Georgenia sp. SYP-B2076]|uniref:DoxX family protein n=1 Tax=Georgenia sp. SYP-B2076 TaxID=2495881 RepID=UPI000F8F61EA|nr:DoxX family membrane protein [Georgenia sp. SYP-B2076]